MYRIIGVNSNGQLKLIKKEALNSTMKWCNSYSADFPWRSSTIYSNINGSSFLSNSSYVPCGSLCVARVKELPAILEFTSFQDTIMFHRRGRFGLEKVQNNEIHVKVVLDMECGNI